MEERARSHELSAATMSSRLSELTALQQTAEHDIDELRTRNQRLTGQLSQLQQQVSHHHDD